MFTPKITCDRCFKRFAEGESRLHHRWQGITQEGGFTLTRYCCGEEAAKCETTSLFRHRRFSSEDTPSERIWRTPTSHQVRVQRRRRLELGDRLETGSLLCSEQEIYPTSSSSDNAGTSDADEGSDGDRPSLYASSSEESEGFPGRSSEDEHFGTSTQTIQRGDTIEGYMGYTTPSSRFNRRVYADRKVDQYQLLLSEEEPQTEAALDSWFNRLWEESYGMETDETIPRLRNPE